MRRDDANRRQLLLQRFGLEAFFAETHKSEESGSRGPAHENHDWHPGLEPLVTTVCYLTLPRQSIKARSYGLSEADMDSDSAFINAAQSSLVAMPQLNRSESRTEQFYRALRTLDLIPYVHESQLKSMVAAETKDLPKQTSNGDSSADQTQDHQAGQ